MAGRSRLGDPWLRFVVIFGGLAVLSEVAYFGLILESGVYGRYLEALASLSAHVLAGVEDGVRHHANVVRGKRFAVQVAAGCDAYRICVLLASAIVAYPVAWRPKLAGLVLGVPFLSALNVARIVGLYVIGAQANTHFQVSHEVYFPVFLMTMTIVTWLVWVRYVAHWERAQRGQIA